jgi:cytidylate kinase
MGGAKILRPDIAKFVVAMDGPAGSGKSTLAKIIAQKLGISHLDTGALYRAVAIKLLKTEVYQEDKPLDQARLHQVLDNTDIQINCETGNTRVVLDNVDISQDIRKPNISRVTSITSANGAVREYLRAKQADVASQQSCVIDGRDIGTVIVPNAEFKFFVRASEHERARRRHSELQSKGQDVDFDSVLVEMQQRDHNDSTREIAPLYQAKDAILVDTTGKAIGQSISTIMRHIYGKLG